MTTERQNQDELQLAHQIIDFQQAQLNKCKDRIHRLENRIHELETCRQNQAVQQWLEHENTQLAQLLQLRSSSLQGDFSS